MNLAFWFAHIVSYAACLKSSNPYCDVLHSMNVRHSKYLVSDIHAMQYIVVQTTAFTDKWQELR